MCCRWSQKILKITQSIGSSFFHCFVQLLHIVFLHWFVCQVRFMLKFSWCIHLFTLFLIPDMISFSFMRFPVYIILLLIFFVSCYYVDSFKWANLFSFLSLSLSLSLCCPATEACHGFHYMGISAHRKEYCWNWAESFIGDAEELSGVVYLFYWKPANVLFCGMLKVVLVNFQNSEFCNQFYQSYFLQIEQEIFAVLTDTFHKPGFKLHVLVLQHLFCLVIIS